MSPFTWVWCITHREHEPGMSRREEKRQCSSRKRETERWVRRARGAIDLFHSCKRCACNANSHYPSHFAKTEAVWREGCLQLVSNAATVILRVQEILFDMMPMSAARNEKHTTWGVSYRDTKKRQSLFIKYRFLRPNRYQLFTIEISPTGGSHLRSTYFLCRKKSDDQRNSRRQQTIREKTPRENVARTVGSTNDNEH